VGQGFRAEDLVGRGRGATPKPYRLEVAIHAVLPALGEFHHLGVACRDLDSEERAWSILGYRQEGADFEDPIQRVRGRFIVGPGPRLELLMPLSSGSPLDNVLSKGIKIYHQAFITERFDAAVEALQAQRCRLVGGPAPAVAFQGCRIAFFALPNLAIVEIIETRGPGKPVA
jgi:methylmalonyl-CoA/ethylmalonyl-CoA epimerase